MENIIQTPRIRTVQDFSGGGAVLPRYVPEGFHGRRQVSGRLGGHVHFEELIEVAVIAILHDHAQGRFDRAHAQHSGDILVFETGQNSHVVL